MFDAAVFTAHSEDQMRRRNVPEAQVRTVLADPESVIHVRDRGVVAQGIVAMGNPTREYLRRVFVDIDRSPAEIVTVYRTSRIAKCRSVQ